MTILFNSIPTTLRTPGPYIEIDNARAAAETVSMPEIALLIGMRLAAGTVAENVPTEVASVEAGEEYFGHGSMLAHMIEGFKNANPHTELWAIAVDEDGAGTAATGTIVFSGTSTAAGNVYLYIGGERIVTAIPSGTAAAAVGPLVVTAVTAHMTTSNMPVVASGPAATTTFTALHKTTLGDDLDIRLNYNANEALPAGITAVVTNIGDVVAGAGTDTISAVITAMADDWYTTIANCFYDDTNMDLMEAELTTRWGPTSMRDGVCFISAPGNQAALTALGNARNSQFTCYMGAGLSPTPTWYWAAVTAAVDAGESDAARPRQTLQLPGCLAPAKGSQFTQTERGVLLTDGIATYTVGVADGLVRVERLITTYQSNSLSVPDTSYLDVTTMRTLAYLRWSWAARITTKFPRHKLADDGTNFAPGQAVVTPAIIRAEALGIFRDDWEPAGLVEGWEQFKEDLRVERSATDDNRVDLVMSPDLMNQFRVFAGQIQFLL